MLSDDVRVFAMCVRRCCNEPTAAETLYKYKIVYITLYHIKLAKAMRVFG